MVAVAQLSEEVDSRGSEMTDSILVLRVEPPCSLTRRHNPLLRVWHGVTTRGPV
jgi:hypothetical protein